MSRVGVIVNPNSRANKRDDGARIARMRSALGDRGEIIVTDSLDHLQDALRDLLRKGTTHIVADGGDGTLHWTLNALWAVMAEPEFEGRERPVIVPTRGGTLGVVARKAGLKGPSDKILRDLLAALDGGGVATQELDSLEIIGHPVPGKKPLRVLGFAVIAGGVGQRFFVKYYEHDDPGMRTLFQIVARTLVSWVGRGAYSRELFSPTRAEVTIDGERMPWQEYRGLNASSLDLDIWKVFRAFPLAREPGQLHFQVGSLGAFDIIRNIPMLVSGRLLRSKRVREVAGEVMDVVALDGERLSIVIDGETFDAFERLSVRRGPRVRMADLQRR